MSFYDMFNLCERDPVKAWLLQLNKRNQAFKNGTLYLACPDGEYSDCDACGYVCVLKPPKEATDTDYDFTALRKIEAEGEARE